MRREVFAIYTNKIVILALLAVMLGCEIMLAGEVSHAETATANATVTVAEACTMTAIVDSAHSAIVNPGQYVSEIGQTTLKVVCNDASGYAIYAVGNANNEYGNNKLLASLGGTLNPTYDIATGTATSGSTSNWAMKVNAVSGAYTPTIQSDTNGSFASYHIVPTTYTKVASYNAVTDATIGSSITSTYAAYVKQDQPAGNYDGKVKYTMVHPATETPAQPQTCPSNKICYFANAGNTEGTMGQQSITSSATTATLLASNYSRTGYGFAGWSDKYDYESNPNAHFYGPQEDITFTAGQYYGTNKGLPLYAVWIKSAGSLQDTSKVATLCGTGAGSLTAAATDGTANLGSVSALTDQRDNQTYAIAKLADGKCWMIENLRLESRDTVGDNRFDSSITNQSLAQGYGTSTTYGNFSGLADAESANFSNSTTANSLYYSGTQSGEASIDIGTTNYPGYRMPRYNTTNTSVRASSPTSNGVAMYSYGNYYTWHAAIADTTYYSSGDHGTTSLCPTGWRLPIGNQSTATNSFGALSVALGGPEGGATANSSSTPTGAVMSKAFRSYPNNFLYSGNFYTSSAYNRGSYGYYWSSTANDINYSYYLSLHSSNVTPGTNYNDKYSGFSIRCTVSAGA
ncbi:hypothetical protein IKD98_02100 [Candidatus Saccharibacteria bacterium]|nr:hypothetical protein [Candidatus Saccharibacteria bacterium]